MKKLKKKIYTGMLAVGGALTFTACTNRPECVYGPPPDIQETVNEPLTVEPETDKGKYDAKNNIPEDVYGPPSYWEDETEETDVYDPEEDDMPVCVYGPPEYFENK